MTLILSRRDVLELLTLRDCIDALEDAFRLHADGRTLGPGVLGVPAENGGFRSQDDATFPENAQRFGCRRSRAPWYWPMRPMARRWR